MTLPLLFWILMLLWLVAGGIRAWAAKNAVDLVPFLAVAVLGWAVFGPAVKA